MEASADHGSFASAESTPPWIDGVPRELSEYYAKCTGDNVAFSRKVLAEAKPPIRRFSHAYCEGDTTGTFSKVELPPVNEFLERRWTKVKGVHERNLTPEGAETMDAACPEFLERSYLCACLVDLLKDVGDDPNFHEDKDRFPNLKILSEALAGHDFSSSEMVETD